MADSSEGCLGIGLDGPLTRRQVLQAGLTGGASVGLAACGETTPVSVGASAGPDFKVGAVLPVSKVYAELGASITNGMKLYLDKVGNKAAGRKIVVLFEDEEASPDVALAKARKLVAHDSVSMIAGYVASPHPGDSRYTLYPNSRTPANSQAAPRATPPSTTPAHSRNSH